VQGKGEETTTPQKSEKKILLKDELVANVISKKATTFELVATVISIFLF
jgi:hypothetical protein